MIGDCARRTITRAVESLSRGVLRDPEHIRSNTSQALRLYESSGLSLDMFMIAMKESYSAVIRKPDLHNPAAYFFSVLGERALTASGRRPCAREFISAREG